MVAVGLKIAANGVVVTAILPWRWINECINVHWEI